jgi:hypothetical protein
MPSQHVQFAANRMDLGLNLQSARNLQLGEISSGKSARVERGSGIYTGPGFRQSAQPTAGVAVDGMEEATVFPALWIKNGTTIQYSTDAVNFYTTGVTATADKRTSFLEQGNGDMFAINTTDAPLRFAVMDLDTAIAASDNTITIGSVHIDKLAATGTVYVNGTAYTYTGKSGGNITGVQEGGGAVTTAQAVGSLVIQSSNPGTFAEEKGDIAVEFESRMFVAGVADKENIIYYTGPTDESNPEFFYDFDANGAYQHFLRGKVTGMISGAERLYAFSEKGVFQGQTVDVSTGVLSLQPLSTAYGAYNNQCIVDMDGVVAFMGQRRLMPITLTLSPEATATPFLDDSFDHRLRPWLDSHDTNQNGAFLDWNSADKILKIGAKVDGALQVYAYDKQANAFLPRENRNRRSFSMFKGKPYFGSRDNGKIFEEDTGRTNDGSAIIHKWATGRMEIEKGRKHMEPKTFEYQGFMTKGAEHTLRIYINGSSEASFEKSYTDSLITSTSGTALGEKGVGVSQIGGETGGGTQVFPYENSILLVGLDGDDFKFEWEVNKEGSFFQVNSFNLEAYVTRKTPNTFS